MEKPEVLVGSIEEEHVTAVLEWVRGGCAFNTLDGIVSAFKTKIEEECWRSFELAQALTFGQEQSALDESKARHREEVDRFNQRVQAFVAHEKAHNEKHHKE